MDPTALLESFLGTAFGAGLALGIAAITASVQRYHTELANLNVLLAEMHYRRAIAALTPRKVTTAAFDDRDRAGSSVIAIRSLVADARRALRPGSRAFDVLGQMTTSCNTYLELSASLPAEYQFWLLELRHDLHRSSLALHTMNKRIKRLLPGDGAFARRR